MSTASAGGLRALRHWRFALLAYHLAHKTKYRLEAFLITAATKALLPDRFVQELTWSRFVNFTGGKGNNPDADFSCSCCCSVVDAVSVVRAIFTRRNVKDVNCLTVQTISHCIGFSTEDEDEATSQIGMNGCQENRIAKLKERQENRRRYRNHIGQQCSSIDEHLSSIAFH